ncbi:MAG: TIGR04282 family arsenosugar biosynthesis glycosyltransferase [Thermodesulfobacteriota bacterium]|nr:TIGR04282 family arsenosugar biosynthesis glycosyltransferase [Thermodesulfobacteriota bacterium]
MTKDKAVILFLKDPERGAVKTRLANRLGDGFTFELYKRFIADMLEICEMTNEDIFIACFYGSHKEGDFLREKGYPILPQRGPDIGIRMCNAFRDVGSHGYRRLALIGSDMPDLPHTYLERGFQKLEERDIVFGPSLDGGYYMIALGSDNIDCSIFDDVPWSTSRALECTIDNAKRKGMNCHLLPLWSDIDEIDDLRRFYERNRDRGDISHTMSLLLQNEELLYD